VGVRNKYPVYPYLRAELLNDVQPTPRIEKAIHGVKDQEGITEGRPSAVVPVDHMERVRDAGDADALCRELFQDHSLVKDSIPDLRGWSRGSKVIVK